MAFRAEPRFTRDVDLAVAVADDREAEGIVNRLQVRGYALASLVEQDYVSRLATARRVRPLASASSAFIDLLFANSGIEDEVVRRADRLEVPRDVFMPVASTGHLIALKALAGRHQDSAARACPKTWQPSSARPRRNNPGPSVAAVRDLGTYWRSGAVDIHYGDAGGGLLRSSSAANSPERFLFRRRQVSMVEAG